MTGPIASRVVAMAAALALVPLAATTAMAGNFGSQGTPGTGGTTNGVWLTTNASWAVAAVNLNEYATAVDNTVLLDYTTTDLNATGPSDVSSCSGSSGWDLCVFDSNYGDNGLHGWNSCAGFVNGAHPNQRCTLDWVRINQYQPPPENDHRFVACHEIGHSVGLRHTDALTNPNSCLRSDLAATPASPSAHDKAHLNAAY